MTLTFKLDILEHRGYGEVPSSMLKRARAKIINRPNVAKKNIPKTTSYIRTVRFIPLLQRSQVMC